MSRRSERCGQGAPPVRQVRAKKANTSEPLMTCRKRSDDIKTGVELLPRDEPGGNLPTAQVVSGMKAARAWLRLRCGTWEPVAPRLRPGNRLREGDPRAADTARGSVPGGTGADRPVVATRPGNAGGAKGAGCPGSPLGQPARERAADLTDDPAGNWGNPSLVVHDGPGDEQPCMRQRRTSLLGGRSR